jgi:hypothetical protein
MDEKSREKITEAILGHSQVFLSQEKIYAYYNTLYFTEFRLLRLSISGKKKNEVPIENVLSFHADTKNSAKLGSLLVETKDGASVNFGNIIDKKYEEFLTVWTKIQSGKLPEYVKAPNVVSDEFRCSECGWNTFKWVGRCGECQAWGSIDKGTVSEASPSYGDPVARESFGKYTVVIFSGGFVQISKLFGRAQLSIEKLLQIEAESQISKKTGLGRGLATIMTAGVNQMSPNQRGNLILTVTTDKNVHVLIQDVPFEHDMKAMQKLAAVGRSVINQGARSTLTEVDKVAPGSQSLAQQIRELSKLKDAGIISQQEFESAKQKLLS